MSGPMAPLKLVVEGANDLHVVRSICDLAGVPLGKNSIECQEYPHIFSVFSTRVRVGSGENPVGMLVDADDDVNHRWGEVASLLRELKVASVPHEAPANGFIGTVPSGRRVGVWLTPDNSNAGVIESLFVTLLRPDDADLPLAKQYVDQFTSGRNWNGFDRLKADVYSWLAVRPNPGRPMGENISRTDFPGELSEPARRLAAWVKALCEPVSAD